MDEQQLINSLIEEGASDAEIKRVLADFRKPKDAAYVLNKAAAMDSAASDKIATFVTEVGDILPKKKGIESPKLTKKEKQEALSGAMRDFGKGSLAGVITTPFTIADLVRNVLPIDKTDPKKRQEFERNIASDKDAEAEYIMQLVDQDVPDADIKVALADARAKGRFAKALTDKQSEAVESAEQQGLFEGSSTPNTDWINKKVPAVDPKNAGPSGMYDVGGVVSTIASAAPLKPVAKIAADIFAKSKLLSTDDAIKTIKKGKDVVLNDGLAIEEPSKLLNALYTNIGSKTKQFNPLFDYITSMAKSSAGTKSVKNFAKIASPAQAKQLEKDILDATGNTLLQKKVITTNDIFDATNNRVEKFLQSTKADNFRTRQATLTKKNQLQKELSNISTNDEYGPDLANKINADIRKLDDIIAADADIVKIDVGDVFNESHMASMNPARDVTRSAGSLFPKMRTNLGDISKDGKLTLDKAIEVDRDLYAQVAKIKNPPRLMTEDERFLVRASDQLHDVIKAHLDEQGRYVYDKVKEVEMGLIRMGDLPTPKAKTSLGSGVADWIKIGVPTAVAGYGLSQVKEALK